MNIVNKVKELFSYCPTTGVFIRKTTTGGRVKGTRAGSVVRKGYRRLSVCGRSIPEHNAAWMIMTGSPPKKQVDHINRVAGDNRWENLRELTPAENQRNKGMRKDNSTGFKGVQKHNKKFRARLNSNGKRYCSTVFNTPEEAAHEYDLLAVKHYGKYAKLNYRRPYSG